MTPRSICDTALGEMPSRDARAGPQLAQPPAQHLRGQRVEVEFGSHHFTLPQADRGAARDRR
jgi:hypothetical protein